MSEVFTNRFERVRWTAKAVLFCVGLIIPLTSSGCVNLLVMAGKVLGGDPIQPAGFEVITGVSLEDSDNTLLVHCIAPSYVSSDYDSLTADVQEELIRRMKRHHIPVLHPDAAANILDGNGGTFDAGLLARKLDNVDYIALISIQSFQFREEQSPDLYRGRASGRIVVFEVTGEINRRQTLRVYDQDFSTVHPVSHPVTSDQMPQNVFIRRFIDQIADDLGRSFYTVSQGELFAR